MRAGILGTGPMMGMGGNGGQFKQPMSPPAGECNVSPGMQGSMRPNQNQMKEITKTIKLGITVTTDEQPRRANLINNLESSSLMGNRSNILGGGLDRNDIDDGRNSLPGDLSRIVAIMKTEEHAQPRYISKWEWLYGSNHLLVSQRNLLDAGSSLLSNMQQAVFGQEGQRLKHKGGNLQSIIGQGNMQSIMGQQGEILQEDKQKVFLVKGRAWWKDAGGGRGGRGDQGGPKNSGNSGSKVDILPLYKFQPSPQDFAGRATEMTEAQKAEVDPEVMIAGITDQIVHLLMIKKSVTQIKKEQYDPAEPTEDEENAATELAWIKKEAKDEGSSDKKSFFCHACMVECQDFGSRSEDRKGEMTFHLDRDLLIEGSTIICTLGIISSSMFSLDSKDTINFYNSLTISLSIKFYGRGRFQTPHQPPLGRNTFHASQTQSDRDRRRRRDRDIDESSNASFPGDLGDMVTVDEIGFEEHDDASTQCVLLAYLVMHVNQKQSNKFSTMKVNKISTFHYRRLKIVDMVKKQNRGGKKESLPEDADDYVIPDYDPTKAVGQKYVVPVSGYFCKLCLKFYTTEASAKTNHCQSKQHYDKFNAVMMDKLITKALAKEEEEEKRTEDASPKEEKKEDETKVMEEIVSTEPVNGKSVEKENVSSDDPVNGKKEEENTEEKMEEDSSENPIDSTPTTENETVNGSSENKVEAKSETAEISDVIVTVPNQKAKAVKKVAQKAKRGKKT
ncbi:unnamed protein product [Mytilus edulis]|uniref:Matrin-type domain-containing protein n=1 Tax=Mytilus edulis TaxID=6550 RepID=A0A8S3U1K4_MYTED|nr:unnamed protein product [Mytilus edulis]